MIHAMRVVLLGTLMALGGCTTTAMWGSIYHPKPHLNREQVSDLWVRVEPGSQPGALRLVGADGGEAELAWEMAPSKHTEVARALLERPALFDLHRVEVNSTWVANESVVLQHDAELRLSGVIAFEHCRVPLGCPVQTGLANTAEDATLDQKLKRRHSESFLPKRLVRLPDALRECAFRLLEVEQTGNRVSAFAFVQGDRPSLDDWQHGLSELSQRLCALQQFDVLVRFAPSREVHRLRCDWLLLAGEAGGFGPLVHRSNWKLQPVSAHAMRRPALGDSSMKLTRVRYRAGRGWDMPVWQKALVTPLTLAVDSIYLPIVAAGAGLVALVACGLSGVHCTPART